MVLGDAVSKLETFVWTLNNFLLTPLRLRAEVSLVLDSFSPYIGTYKEA